ncbi:MAG TPA: pyridoxal 5'-phosphate synthase glutaminase subunit PdxT [Bacillus sp. (in: Bacteria)]|jgi:pyridoxal 5'-phosphate synthase pdxT subunit|uniref:Pyridoxal 5'-phosphate synthase subunit PdxT n=7 Tax=Bacillus cereus group TaxID=86661 RepID=A0A9X7LQT6_BACCE|nr:MULTISPECIES: pyridoxal 5'-phosphate synthase glutaminase subunit PdxT [Bacillus]ANN30232.1 glutamine amidotransferase subunit PdxT [Bacillus thuringiensis serovar coreanensis]MCU7387557.1 pyridoxal 5'-phosphate synthase glutaminase subunit PdxT [Bacillus sp. ST24]CEY74569.1 glutamine amidotransferase subunit PdxT [Streptococcus pneumoniae]BCA34513.1 pyridoxal 5'-phosphate synthase subunit PdxT [Bacillus wiedmannii]HCF54224.1 pyridoxal 5'-phosphate synthase glutaminase subunit PdxT [Bacillu
MVKIGVLGLQGAVREHVKSVEASGAEAVVVKRIEQLEEIDGLILPGGESTTMRRLIDKYAFMEPLRTFAKSGKPMFGTCAGMILLAKTLIGYEEAHIGAMDITVERNAFGRQKDSFEAALSIEGVGEDFIGVFIRAPYVVEVADNVEVLSKHGDRMVAVRQDQFLAASFHPELTDDHRVTAYFVEMVKEAKMKKVV